MGKNLKVWYDPEADLFQVYFENKAGYYAPTDDNRVEVRLDNEGNVIGFNILRARTSGKSPIEIELKPRQPESIEQAGDGDE